MAKVARPSELKDFGDLLLPDEAAEPILARPVRAALMEWLTEIWAAEELAAVKIKPRRRAIFDGPPGVGKTTLAHHLSARLGLPMLAVRPDRIVDCWLGSTGRNIGSLFDAVSAANASDGAPIVLFLDEFDAISPKRTQARQGAEVEQNTYVNTLLQRLEQHDGFVIAATNFADHIDPAMWRRFDIQIRLELPGDGERRRIVARYLEPFGLPAGPLGEVAEALAGASPALIRVFCENVKRQIVLGPRLGLDMSPAAVVGRVLATTHPHPELGKPRLWSHGVKDRAVACLPWPLPMAADLAAGDAGPPEAGGTDKVVRLERRK